MKIRSGGQLLCLPAFVFGHSWHVLYALACFWLFLAMVGLILILES